MVASVATIVDSTGILARIEGINSLPTPPLVFSQINRVISDPNASAYDIAAIVSEDQAIAARVLRMVNSAFYGLHQPVASIRQAIVILGMDALRTLVLSAVIVDAFAGSPFEREYQDTVWRHSLATATAARVIVRSRFTAGVIRTCEEGFSAGLLHDIGKTILACYLPDQRAKIRSHPDYGFVEDRLVERDAIGVTHEMIGAYLAERWQLPLVLRMAILHHHDLATDNPEHRLLAKIVHFADYLAHAADPATQKAPRVLPCLDTETVGEFRIDDQMLDDLIVQVREDYDRAETFLEMARGL